MFLRKDDANKLQKAQGFIVLCLSCMLAQPVYAQSDDIINRLQQLENDLQTLNRAVYRGEPLPEPSYRGGPTPMPLAQDSAVQANIEIRLQQMEEELRNLTGRVEEQNYQMQQLQDRLTAIETAAATQPSAAPQAQPYMNSPAYQNPAAGGNGSLQYTDPAGYQDVPQPESTTSPLYQGQAQVQTTMATGGPQIMEPAALYETSYSILRSGNYGAAEQSFQKFLDQYPDHRLAANATYWLGETYYVRNQYEDAARVFAQGYQKFPSGPKTPDSLLKLALSLSGLNKKQESCIALKQLKTEFPGGSQAVLQRADKEISDLGCS